MSQPVKHYHVRVVTTREGGEVVRMPFLSIPGVDSIDAVRQVLTVLERLKDDLGDSFEWTGLSVTPEPPSPIGANNDD